MWKMQMIKLLKTEWKSNSERTWNSRLRIPTKRCCKIRPISNWLTAWNSHLARSMRIFNRIRYGTKLIITWGIPSMNRWNKHRRSRNRWIISRSLWARNSGKYSQRKRLKRIKANHPLDLKKYLRKILVLWTKQGPNRRILRRTWRELWRISSNSRLRSRKITRPYSPEPRAISAWAKKSHQDQEMTIAYTEARKSHHSCLSRLNQSKDSATTRPRCWAAARAPSAPRTCSKPTAGGGIWIRIGSVWINITSRNLYRTQNTTDTVWTMMWIYLPRDSNRMSESSRARSISITAFRGSRSHSMCCREE